MKALVRIQTKRRPQSGEVQGLRLQAAVPNMQGRKSKANFNAMGEVANFYVTDEAVPVFRKPYLITETGDNSNVTESVLERFLKAIRWEGYTHFEFIGDWDDCLFDLRPFGGPVNAWVTAQLEPA